MKMNKTSVKLAVIFLISMVAICFIIYLIICGTKESFESPEKADKPTIPKKIWTFWDNTNLPDTVVKCIDSWRRYNPDYEITVLSKASIKEYLPEKDIYKLKHATTPQRISDFIRIHIIKKHGGFWLDASILLTESLDWIRDIQQKDNYELVGYYIGGMTTNNNYPIIENWFFAAIPNSEFISKWCETFLLINNYNNIGDYVNAMRKGADLQNIDNPKYLTMHVAAQYVMQKYMTPKDIKEKLYLMKAEDGPFKYLSHHDWKKDEAIKALCADSNLKTPIIKFRGGERNFIENNKSEYSCVWGIS